MSNSILQKNITAIQSIDSNLSDVQIKKRLNEFRIDIALDSLSGESSNIMDTVYVLLNLLPRLFSGVRLVGDPNLLNNFPPSHRALINIGEKEWNPSIVIKLGNKPIQSDNPILYVGSCGWTAYLSTSQPCLYSIESQNPIGAILAGGLAAGEVFKMAFSDFINVTLCPDLTYDPLTHGTGKAPVVKPEIPKEIYLEDLTLIGVGAIGTSLIYCLGRLPRLTGKLTLIDHETTDESNEQRYLLSFKENRGIQKVQFVEHLSRLHPLLEIMAFGAPYEAYIQICSHARTVLSSVITTVDTDKTRRNVQAALPKTILNGWTEADGTNLGYGIGKHEFLGPYECLACAYFPKSGPSSQEEFYSLRTGFNVDEIKRRLRDKIPTTQKDIESIARNTGADIKNLMRFLGRPLDDLLHGQCGIFTIPLPGKLATAPVPHIPLLVAVHLASQLLIPYLEPTPEIKPIESAAVFNGLDIPTINNLELRKKEPRCICSDTIYQEAYKEKWNILIRNISTK